jgi:hypothetical protein
MVAAARGRSTEDLMTRIHLAPLAAGLLAAACSGPAPERAKPPVPPPAATAIPAPPVVVDVVAAKGSGLEGETWAKELREAVGARAGDLQLAAKGTAADIVVRIEKIQHGVAFKPEPPGEGKTEVVHGTFVASGRTRPFTLGYRGEARPQVEALARNLRAIAREIAAHEAASPAEPGAPH